MTLAIALTLCCGDNRLAAQVTTATVEGVLTDPTGAVIPGTKIVVTNTATKISREAITDGSGRYQVPQLNPGRYSITVSAPGFETLNQNGVTLEVGQELTLPLKLTPGSTTDQITVTDSPPQVNTTSSIVADVVDQKAIENLPLNGRDFSQLPLTTAGVTASRNVSTSTTMGYGVKIVMAGSRPDVTAWLMDGTNIKGITNYGTPADVSGAMLGVGAMQEFQTVVTGFPAEFGQTSGGVINMLTKSGSNAFHGEGLIYARNDLFDAWNYFDQAKQPLSKYQYGGSIGGPIIKDKTFFFVNYEGVVQHHGQTVVSYVPGNDTLNAVTAPELAPYVNVWRTVTPANNDTDTGGTYKEQAGIGQNVQAYNIPILENYFLARVDHQITPKQHIFARFNFDNGKITQPDALPISAVTVEVRTRFSAIQYEKIINDHLISTSRGAYNRTVLHSNTAPTPAALSALFAVPDSLASGPILFQPWGTASPPQIQLPGGATVFSPVSTEQFLRLQNIFEGQESVQWILGPHTIKAGVDFQQIDYNQLASGPGQFGSFTYGTLGNFECDCDSTHQGKAPLSGTQILPFTVDGHEPRQWKQFITAGWVQDDWKLAHNVTLNAGIRYEPFTVPTEKFNRYATLTDWTTATAWAVAPAPVIPARIAGYQANVPLWRGDAMVDLMPRVGFAWDVKGDGKTAVRGGFGIFFVDIMDTYYGTPGQVNAPFYGTIATTAATAGTGTGIYNLATSQNDTALTGPNALSVTLNASTGAKTLIQYDLAPSYEMKYNLSLDRELGKGYSATAELVAGRGVHLWRTFATNYAPATLNNGRPYVASAAGVIDPLTGQGSIHQADAQSFYNAAVFQAKKRFSNGAQVQTSYTYAKNIDDSTSGGVTGVGNEPSTNVPDFAKSDRARSGLFQKHTFLLNGVFPLPYSTKTKWLGYATKGWQLSGVVIANSGEPFTVTASGNLTAPTAAQITAGTTICASVAACPGVTTSIPAKATSLPLNLGSGSTPNGVTANAERPDYAPGRVPSNIKLNPGLKKSQPYFDTSAFVPAAYGFYGNVGRNTLIGPNYANVDASIKRTIPLYGDRYQLQLTADVFNLLNHPNFLIPGTTTATNYAAAYTAPTTAVPIPYQNASAGFLTSTVNNNFSNRQMQFSAKVSF
jgi:hypothetical protein